MDAVKLYRKFSIEELERKIEEVKADPKNKQEGFYMYTPAARRKLDALAWAITYHLHDLRAARGETVSTGEGYTGQKQNRH